MAPASLDEVPAVRPVVTVRDAVAAVLTDKHDVVLAAMCRRLGAQLDAHGSAMVAKELRETYTTLRAAEAPQEGSTLRDDLAAARQDREQRERLAGGES